MIEQAQHQNRRIVVGVDNSPGSKTALRWALDQAQISGAAVEAVTAWQDPTVYDGWVPTPIDGDAVAASTEKALMDTVVEVTGTRDQPIDVRVAVAEGPAAQVLLAAAVGAELLVVGSRGHGAFAGMMLGSVSQHCVQHPPCAVAVIQGVSAKWVPGREEAQHRSKGMHHGGQ